MDVMIYKKKAPAIFFIFPAFLFLTVFLYYPFVMNIINSFQEISVLGGVSEGNNGIQNYITLFQDPTIKVALINSLWMMASAIIFQVGFALMLALMVDNITKGAQFFRTVFFFPIVISGTALALLFRLMYLYNEKLVSANGLFNQILIAMGLTQVDFFNEKNALISILVPVVWQYVGFYFVIILTGLNNISEDIYESASIDGAVGLKKIRYITLPLVYNVLCTCLTLAITGALKVYDLPWVLAPNGAPNGVTHFTGTYMYSIAFQRYDVDYGATIAVLIVILGVVIAQIANLIFRPKDY